MPEAQLTAAQCRGARAMLGWKQAELCAAAHVSKMTLADFEGEKRTPHPRTLDAIRSALEAAGAIFIEENGEGPGVRLRKGASND